MGLKYNMWNEHVNCPYKHHQIEAMGLKYNMWNEHIIGLDLRGSTLRIWSMTTLSQRLGESLGAMIMWSKFQGVHT